MFVLFSSIEVYNIMGYDINFVVQYIMKRFNLPIEKIDHLISKASLYVCIGI